MGLVNQASSSEAKIDPVLAMLGGCSYRPAAREILGHAPLASISLGRVAARCVAPPAGSIRVRRRGASWILFVVFLILFIDERCM